MKVIDNFLCDEDFKQIENEICHSHKFPFYPYEYQVHKGDGQFQFVHEFYSHGVPISDKIDIAFSFMNKITSKGNYVPLRIKANCTTKTHEHEKSSFHIDLYDIIQEYETAIFYVNTNNGWTEFEDGTKVESVANRMVMFSGKTKHRGVSQTDIPFRYVINFNYLKCLEMDKDAQ